MKRSLVILACTGLLLAGVGSESVGAQTADATYSLNPSGGAAVHDRQATIDGTDIDVESVVGMNPDEETLVGVTVPEGEPATVTLRSPDGDVLKQESVTDGENVVINSTDYEAGTYHLVLSTEGVVRTVSLVVVSQQRVSFDVENATDESVSVGITVPDGVERVDDDQRVQFVLSNETVTYRTNASEVRNGLYEANASLDGVAAGNYTVHVEVVEETSGGPGEILSATRASVLTVDGDESAAADGPTVATESKT